MTQITLSVGFQPCLAMGPRSVTLSGEVSEWTVRAVKLIAAGTAIAPAAETPDGLFEDDDRGWLL